MIIHGWKFERKKKSGLFKKTKKKMVLNKKMKKKRKEKERKELEVQFEHYCVKLVELMLLEKKNCAPLVFKNYFVPYISFLHS